MASTSIAIRCDGSTIFEPGLFNFNDADRDRTACDRLRLKLNLASKRRSLLLWERKQRAVAENRRADYISCLRRYQEEKVAQKRLQKLNRKQIRARRNRLVKCSQRQKLLELHSQKVLHLQEQHCRAQHTIEGGQRNLETSLPSLRNGKVVQPRSSPLKAKQAIDSVAAAKILQTWCMDIKRVKLAKKKVLRVADEVVLFVEKKREFERMNTVELETILRSKDFKVSVVKLLSGLRLRRSPQSQRMKEKAARILITSLMIQYHSEDILQGHHPYREGQLKTAAAKLLLTLEEIAEAIKILSKDFDTKMKLQTKLYRLLQKFNAIFSGYIVNFNRWQTADGECMANEMLQGYEQVYGSYLAEAAIAERETGQYERDGRVEILSLTEQQLMQIEGAVAKLIGRDATKRRVESIREAVYERSLQRSQEQNRADSVAAESSSASQSTEVAQNELSDTVIASQSSQDGVDPLEDKALVIMKENTALAHELILDPQKVLGADQDKEQISEDPMIAFQKRLEEQYRRAFWDTVQADVCQSPPNLERVSQLLNEARTAIVDAVGTNNSRVTNELHDILGTEVVRLVCTAEDPERLVRLFGLCARLLAFLKTWESPGRTESTVAWLQRLSQVASQGEAGGWYVWENAGALLVQYLTFLFDDKIAHLKEDMAKFHLRMLIPYLQRHGVEYERKYFEKKLGKGLQGLQQTQKWIVEQVAAASESENLTAEEVEAIKAGDSKVYSKVVRLSLLGLLRDLHKMKGPGSLPETLALDARRLYEARDAVDTIALVGSALALARQVHSQRSSLTSANSNMNLDRAKESELRRRLKILLRSPKVTLKEIAPEVVKVVKDEAQAKGSCIAEHHLESLRKNIESLSIENAVYKVISARVYSIVEEYLAAEVYPEDMVLHFHLVDFTEELHQIGRSLLDLYRHNIKVHAMYYNQIVRSAVNALEDSSKEVASDMSGGSMQ